MLVAVLLVQHDETHHLWMDQPPKLQSAAVPQPEFLKELGSLEVERQTCDFEGFQHRNEGETKRRYVLDAAVKKTKLLPVQVHLNEEEVNQLLHLDLGALVDHVVMRVEKQVGLVVMSMGENMGKRPMEHQGGSNLIS